MREGPKAFLQKAVPVWLPPLSAALNAYGWPADLKVICSISASFAASLLYCRRSVTARGSATQSVSFGPRFDTAIFDVNSPSEVWAYNMSRR
jgi:hypothetical protein